MPLAPRFSFEQDAQQLVIEVYLPGTSLRSTDIYGLFASHSLLES